MKARSAKAKGTRLEKWVSAALESVGLKARRQPGSGIYSAFPHDVECIWPGVGRLVVECKSRKEGHRQLDKWLGAADLLVIKADYGTPNVYMSWQTFQAIAQQAQEGPSEARDGD